MDGAMRFKLKFDQAERWLKLKCKTEEEVYEKHKGEKKHVRAESEKRTLKRKPE